MTSFEPPQRVAGLEPSLPSDWYRSEACFRLEKERIFCSEWYCVGREEELTSPGAGRVIDVLGESVLLVRNRDAELRAYYNVCRHRGAQLCRPEPTAPRPRETPCPPGGLIAGRSIMCPYHRWTYDLEGRLIAAPHLAGQEDFDRSAFSLYPVGVATWGGFVFLHLTPARAAPLEPQLAPISARVERYPLASLRIGRSLRYRVAANWKVICENYNECYHCGSVHPELCEVVPAFRDKGGADLDWIGGIPHRPGAYTFTSSGTSRRVPFATLNAEERVRHKGELLYPNLFMSLACEHAAVFILEPRSAGLTDITCHFLFEPAEIARPDFDASDVAEFWDLVNRQDWGICESVQRGLTSRVHDQGYYAPMEDYNLDIRRYVMDRIGTPAASQ